MSVHEVRCYFMTTKQLGGEVKRLSRKLDAEIDVKKRVKYLNQLGDVAKELIRRYRHDEEFMKYVTNELDKLRTQIKEVL